MGVCVPCNLCEVTSDILLFKKDGFNIVKCNNCGLVYVNPRPSTESLRAQYQKSSYFKKNSHSIGYRDYFTDERLHSITFEHEFNFIEKIKKKKGYLLDVGCAAGFSLKVAKEKGWKVNGVEISEFAAKYAKERFGIDVFRGSLEEANYPNNYFDVITAYSTLEHIENPLGFLREVNRILKQDGLSVITIPDIGSWLGSRKFQFKPLEHLYYFNRNTLTLMLDKAKMEVFIIRPMRSFRSIRFLCERLKYYFKNLTPLANIIESTARKINILDFSFFMPDGHIVVYARKK